MKFISFAFSAFLCLSLIVDAAPIKNQKLIKTLKASPRWLLLPLVEDSEKGAKLAPHAMSWLYDKEAELQELDLEIITLSHREQKQVIEWWSQPFTSRLNQKLIEFCQSLNCNLLTAYYQPQNDSSFTYIVYSLEKKRQLVFRSPQAQKKAIAKKVVPQAPVKKTTPQPSQPQVQKTEPPVVHTSPETNSQPKANNSVFSEELQNWLSIKERPERTRSNPDSRRRRKSNHPEVQKQLQAKLHDHLMKNEALIEYAKSEKTKGQTAIEQSCLDHLKSAKDSWMSSSKFEHLSRAYVLNQYLNTPNQELAGHLIKELIERQDFLNSWDSDFTR